MHAAPHWPQFAGLVFRSMQLDPQAWRPAPQEVEHVPCEQTEPAEHTLPHLPQFFGSSRRFTQAPPQDDKPDTHTQLPPTQSCPAWQGLLHAPQWARLVETSTAGAHCGPPSSAAEVQPNSRPRRAAMRAARETRLPNVEGGEVVRMRSLCPRAAPPRTSVRERSAFPAFAYRIGSSNGELACIAPVLRTWLPSVSDAGYFQ